MFRIILIILFSGCCFSVTGKEPAFGSMSPLRQLTDLVMRYPPNLEDEILKIDFTQGDYLVEFGATEIVKIKDRLYLRLFENYADHWNKSDVPTFLAPLYFTRTREELIAGISRFLSMTDPAEKTIVIVFGKTLTVLTSGKKGLDGMRMVRLVYPL